MWQKNNGIIPTYKVDIKLACDEPGMPGVPCIRYNQNPAKWSWSEFEGECRIIEYRKAEEIR